MVWAREKKHQKTSRKAVSMEPMPATLGRGSVETAFLLVYSSFLPDASSMSLLMFYRLASYYAVFAASAVGFALAQRRLNRG